MRALARVAKQVKFLLRFSYVSLRAENKNNSIPFKFAHISDVFFLFVFHKIQNKNCTSKDKLEINRKTRAKGGEKLASFGFV